MNWTYLAFAALVAGVLLIVQARRAAKPIFDAEEISESALWGYFLVLVGAWGVLSMFANASDLFFLVMMVAVVLALIARMMGYKPKGNERALPMWAAFGFSNAVVLGAIGVGKTFLIEPMQIPSSSMRPGLVVGDFILINKFAYGIRIPFLNEVAVPVGKPQRGDVVVFRMPLDPKTNYIKRLIGVPGDTVEYRNKRLSVNGRPYESTPVAEYKYSDSANSVVSVNRMKENMQSKTYETLNDPMKPAYDMGQLMATLARPEFIDTGAKARQEQDCKIDETGFVCKIPQGYYLMMGDNRDNSYDGRYWGFVPDNLLAGRAFMVWMNIHELSRIGKSIG